MHEMRKGGQFPLGTLVLNYIPCPASKGLITSCVSGRGYSIGAVCVCVSVSALTAEPVVCVSYHYRNRASLM